MIQGARLLDPTLEWLEADGLGGFASGTAGGWRTRRYHGLLCVARTPPTGRVLLVAGVEAWVDLGHGPRALSTHRYLPGVGHPDGITRLSAFSHEPCPTWTFEPEPGVRVVQRLIVPRGSAEVVLTWSLEGGPRPARLTLRPLLALRDVHALEREREGLELASTREGRLVRWRPDPVLPGVVALASGEFRAEPLWYRNFLHEEERARGYDHVEDLLSPGTFEDDLGHGDACLVLAAEAAGSASPWPAAAPARSFALERCARELERRAALAPLERAAEAYVVRRGAGRSLIAGYPWFTDWGRDSFLALRGLLLARGEARAAAELLSAWAEHLSLGMLPNRFPDDAEAEFNSVDAALWFVVAVEETLAAGAALSRRVRATLERALREVLAHHVQGTRHGIRVAPDGLLACGWPGTQLTWMDARVDGETITPRVGKPVEVQALWIHALAAGARLGAEWGELARRARAAFEPRFWNEEAGHLNDVVDCEHVAGMVDASLRPNQVLALGGLGPSLLGAERTARALERVERELLTPLGLRTLAPSDPRYQARYAGDPARRDRAYHQGTAWPWLLGPFVEAWVRARGDTEEARAEARRRFLPPLRAHLDEAGLGHVSEVADGDAPHAPGGCPFQAWSLGELLRLERVVLAPSRPRLHLAGRGR